MDINQVRYFLNLAEALNFTEAARRSRVSQPSLTRAIERLEEELGSPLIYRDGKDSRLDGAWSGRSSRVHADRARPAERARAFREHRYWAGAAFSTSPWLTTIGPARFSAFFADVLGQLPSVKINLHQLLAGESADEVLSGKYHACILPAGMPRPNPQTTTSCRCFVSDSSWPARRTIRCAGNDVVATEALASYPYVDRLACEFHSQITEHLMDHDAVMQPRFSAEREDWVQQMVADGRAICIMPEHSAVDAGISNPPNPGHVAGTQSWYL